MYFLENFQKIKVSEEMSNNGQLQVWLFHSVFFLQKFQNKVFFKEISNNEQANKTKITLALYTTIEGF